MNIKCIVYCVVFVSIQFVRTFNFFPKYASVFTIKNPESFFGYSVLLQTSSNASLSRLIVGAPRANSTSQLHKNLIEPGGVYSCSLSDKKCTQYLFYLNGNTIEKSRDRELYHNKRDHGWLGCSIDGSDYFEGSLVACAPRWVNQALLPNYYFAQGVCYHLQDSRQTEKKSDILLPLLNKGKQGYIRANETVYYYAYGEAGISVHISKKNLDILIGAPGILQWRGMVLKYHKDNLGINYDKEDIPNPNNVFAIDDFSLFGYTISSGVFSKTKNQTWYVAGAPRGSKLKGQVLIYEYKQSGDDIKIHYEMTGRQHGEYFGAGLSVGDINNDGVDDVIIGGPLYSTSLEHDAGCVYIYLNDGLGKFIKSIIEDVKTPGGRFGSAISIIGDINDDNYSDVVISAPYYNDNRGAIFIYHGSETGLKEKYSQRIIATEIDSTLRGFGISISRAVDVDGNMYKDIAVGSYLSGHAIIIKTRPVVRINGSLKTTVNQISILTKSVPFSVCITYTGKHLPLNLNIKIKLLVDPLYNRAVINTPYNKYGNMWEVVKLYKYNQLICEDLSLIILDSKLDIIQPITISMEYALAESESADDTFCSTCPVEDKSTLNYTSLFIHYETDCGEDEICQPDLSVKAYFDVEKPYLVQGQDELVRINVEIMNTAEPAYATKLYAEIPLSTSFNKIPDICQMANNYLLQCDFGKPLYRNKTMKLIIPIDISMINPSESFQVLFNLTSLGTDINYNDNFVIIEKEVKSEIQISVIGISDPEQITLTENNIGTMKKKLRFTHTYMVQNLGPSTLNDLKMIFLIPQRIQQKKENILEIRKHETTNLQCNVIDSNFTLYKNEINKTLKAHFRREVINESTSITSMHSALFSKMQKLTGSDNIFPPNIPLNRMKSLNCEENTDVICIKFECSNEIKLKRFEQISIIFSLEADVTLMESLRENRDVVTISTSFIPEFEMITGNWTYTHTLLHGTTRHNYPTKWIVIACVSGIILMIIIVFTLYKYGFFRRHEHEKLLNEKGESIQIQNN